MALVSIESFQLIHIGVYKWHVKWASIMMNSQASESDFAVHMAWGE